jgi:hypothetical protein
MKSIFTLLASIVVATLSAQLPTATWALTPTGNGQCYAYDNAIDLNGNTFILGAYSTQTYNVDLDPSSGTFLVSGIGFFVEKFDPTGNMLWAVPFPMVQNSMTSSITPTDIACDANGNVYCTVNVRDAGIDFYYNQTTDTVQFTYNTNEDMTLTKISPTGNVEWAHMFGNSANEEFNSLICYGSSIYVGGMFGCYTDFDPSDSTAAQPTIAAWCRAGFIAKYNSDGEFIWQKSLEGLNFGDPGYARPRAMVMDENHDLVFAGEMGGTVNFNPGFGLDTLGVYQGQGSDAYFAKYDTNATFIFVKQLLAPVYSVWPTVTTDANNNIIVAGSFQGTLDTDPGPGVNLLVSNNAPNAFTTDVFLAKYDPNGNHLWSGKFGSLNYEDVYEIACDDNDNILISGAIYDTCDIDIGGGVFIAPLTTTATTFPEPAIIKYSPAGSLIYAFCLNGSGYNSYGGIVYDGNVLYCTGSYNGPMDTDPTSATLTLNDDGYVHVKYIDPTVTGIEDLSTQSTVPVVYPNPATEEIQLQDQFSGQYIIFSSDGRRIAEGYTYGRIDIQFLPSGVYVLQLIDEKGMNSITRFLKQ